VLQRTVGTVTQNLVSAHAVNSRFQSYAILWASFGATLALVPGPKEKQMKRETQIEIFWIFL
jgi:hypothetical protein